MSGKKIVFICISTLLAWVILPCAVRADEEVDIPRGEFQPVAPKKTPPPGTDAKAGKVGTPVEEGPQPADDDESDTLDKLFRSDKTKNKGDSGLKIDPNEKGGTPGKTDKTDKGDKPDKTDKGDKSGKVATKPAPATQKAGVKEAPLPPEAHKLLAEFARPLKPEEKETLVSQILAFGPPAARALLAKVQGDLTQKSPTYQALFYQEAQKLAQARLKDLDKAKAKTWQDQVNNLRKEGKVTSEMLHSQAGPALDRLRQALVVSPTEVVLEAEVIPKRKELLAIEAMASRCREVLAAAEAGAGEKSQTSAAETTEPAEPAQPAPATELAELEKTEAVLTLMATAMKPADRRIIESNLEMRRHLSHEEFMGLLTLNVSRTLLDLGAMKIDARLCRAARDHAGDMVEKKFFSHESPVSGKKSPWDRAKLAGTSANGECIAAGSGTGEGTIRMWFFSPGHHMIIMGGSGRVGLGGVGATWTLMTGG